MEIFPDCVLWVLRKFGNKLEKGNSYRIKLILEVKFVNVKMWIRYNIVNFKKLAEHYVNWSNLGNMS